MRAQCLECQELPAIGWEINAWHAFRVDEDSLAPPSVMLRLVHSPPSVKSGSSSNATSLISWVVHILGGSILRQRTMTVFFCWQVWCSSLPPPPLPLSLSLNSFPRVEVMQASIGVAQRIFITNIRISMTSTAHAVVSDIGADGLILA